MATATTTSLKTLANEYTLLQTHCGRHKRFPIWPRVQHLLRTQILCPGHKFCVKALVNEDTLLRTHCCPWCFLGCANWETFVSATMCRQRCVLVCQGLQGLKKCFWLCSETFCVCNKCFLVCAAQETSWATMCPQPCVLVYQGLKALANEDTLLPAQMFPRLPARNIYSGHKFCVRNKCFPVCAAQETLWATMCPRLPGPLKVLVNEDTLLPILSLGLHKLGNICCGHKMFLNKIRNIFCVPDTKFVSATNVARAGKLGNFFVGNNMSVTMCSRLPGP